MNTNLIPVFESTINEELVQTVNARELHAYLGIKSKFADWITNRISDFGFTQDVDFIIILNSENNPGGRPSKEYHVSLDMGKELSMVERTDKGQEVRKYFIRIEKEYLKQSQSFDLSSMTSEALRRLASSIEENAALKSRIQSMRPKEEFFDHVVGSAELWSMKDSAQTLRTSQKRLTDKLVEWKMFTKDRRPTQKSLDGNFFRIVPVFVRQGSSLVPYAQPMVTGKGLSAIKLMMDSTVMSNRRDVVKV